MGRYIIYGGKQLFGAVDIHGSKNAALPVLCACVINSGENIIHNCPKITDVYNTCEILEKCGCSVKWNGSDVFINSSKAHFITVDEDMTKSMRSSVMFMGVFLGKFKKAVVSKPGGCRIGKRPLDIHLDAFEKMGAVVTDNGYCFVCSAEKLNQAEINLKFPSVGATENIMLAAAFITEKTVIKNAAVEPEIIALGEFLKTIGVSVDVKSNNKTIEITGTDKFKNSEYTIIPDRIEAGTFMAACAVTGGEVFLKNAERNHMKAVTDVFESIGCKAEFCNGGIYFKAEKGNILPQNIKTGVYPQFPTDMQPQLMSVLTLAQGTSIIFESVFENRFSHALELNKMGANIETEGRKAIIKGVKNLYPSELNAFDLRAGAGLIVAALSCNGMSYVNGSQHICRGYEAIEKSFSDLGALIRYENR